jgi:hypothetical protein
VAVTGAIVCSVPWPACCGGAPVVSCRGVDVCTGCGSRSPSSPACGRTATHQITDSRGGTLCVCDGHAELARLQVAGATVAPLAERPS